MRRRLRMAHVLELLAKLFARVRIADAWREDHEIEASHVVVRWRLVSVIEVDERDAERVCRTRSPQEEGDAAVVARVAAPSDQHRWRFQPSQRSRHKRIFVGLRTLHRHDHGFGSVATVRLDELGALGTQLVGRERFDEL